MFREALARAFSTGIASTPPPQPLSGVGLLPPWWACLSEDSIPVLPVYCTECPQ